VLVDFSDLIITVVICPQDLRMGFSKLSILALENFYIDVSKGNDCVIFVSKHRNICKIIYADKNGINLLTRKLHQGTYQRLLARLTGPAIKVLSKAELLSYLDGESIMVQRNNALLG
jgi:hypothetical protein